MIVLYVGVQLSKILKLMVCADCVITLFEVQKKGFFDFIALPADACDQSVFIWDEAGCLHFMPTHFLFRTKLWHCVSLPHHNLPQQCVTVSMVWLQLF